MDTAGAGYGTGMEPPTRRFGARRPRPFREPPPNAPRPRGRFGMWGPIPYYSTRTRRGSEVSVGGCGCCLPIPLLAGFGLLGLGRAVVVAVRAARRGGRADA